MRFSTTLIEPVPKIKRRPRRRKASLHVEQAQQSAHQRLSKHYGYWQGEDGKLAINLEEAETVRLIFRRITEGRSLGDIKIELDLRNLRTRFGNKWTTRNLRSFVLHYPWDVHPIIISPAVYHKAVKALRQMSESTFDPTSFFREE